MPVITEGARLRWIPKTLSEARSISEVVVYRGSETGKFNPPKKYTDFRGAGCFFGHGMYTSTSKMDAKGYGPIVQAYKIRGKFFEAGNREDASLVTKHFGVENIPEGLDADRNWTNLTLRLWPLLKGEEVQPVMLARAIEKLGFDGIFVPKVIGGGKGDWYTLFKPQKSAEEIETPKPAPRRSATKSESAEYELSEAPAKKPVWSPQSVSAKDRASVMAWQNGGSDVGRRDQVPVADAEMKKAIIAELKKLTAVRKGKEGPEFRLYRGVSNQEASSLSYPRRSSWTPNVRVAHYFAFYTPGHEGQGVVLSAWIPVSDIITMPMLISRDPNLKTTQRLMKDKHYREMINSELEVIVAPSPTLNELQKFKANERLAYGFKSTRGSGMPHKADDNWFAHQYDEPWEA